MNDNNSIETVTRALEELKGKNYDRLTPEERAYAQEILDASYSLSEE